MPQKTLRILGTRGIPAAHGGFETFAQHLAQHLVDKNWSVTVYCQAIGSDPIIEDEWEGVRLVIISEPREDAIGTMRFDWRCIRHASKEKGLVLTLGYNTALFNLVFRLKGIKNVINMDGLEWKRSKWNLPTRVWFYLNDWAGCLIGHHLIADHPNIARHIASRRSNNAITMIPYGADAVHSASTKCLDDLGIESDNFILCIARPEPENSILEIVRAFSGHRRKQKLVILGAFRPEQNDYHAKVHASANSGVVFPGAIYDQSIVQSLRFHCKLYIHGHTVGGTNPSLVESLGAGAAILAHDNQFNRWVAGNQAAYFQDQAECQDQLDRLLDDKMAIAKMCAASKLRFTEKFTWAEVMDQYEELLEQI